MPKTRVFDTRQENKHRAVYLNQSRQQVSPEMYNIDFMHEKNIFGPKQDK